MKVALKEAERLDMNIWIYDENSYPSSFAGGFVPDAHGLDLALREEQSINEIGLDYLAEVPDNMAMYARHQKPGF